MTKAQMTPERWAQIKDIFAEVLERPSESRRSTITELCKGDPELESEVGRLLSQHDEMGKFLEGPSTGPCSGQLLGHFRLLEQLGAGGMGVVYRAHDEHLDRDVALKVIPPGSFVDDEKRRRFKHEALSLAKLNHPNIATIYDFDCDGNTDFLVMELLPGQSLANKLAAGPLPESVVIDFGIQMGEGLAAAHQQGILHRDLKPANLGLTAEGRLKILDFGLAKLLLSGPSDLTQHMTAEGMVRGTLPYMAPEQLRSEDVDARADVYAAGCVLYEMATGKCPHTEERNALLINAILNQSPALPTTANHAISPELEAVILKALEKDPDRRYQSAQDLVSDLNRLNTSTRPVAVQEASRSRLRRLLRPVLIVAGMLVLGIVSWGVFHRRPLDIANGQRPVLLVGEFENRTGESVFDKSLHEMFTSSLEQSRLVQVFPISRVADVLRRMGQSPAKPLDESTGLEICQRENLQGLLAGSIVRLGQKYLLIVRLEAPSGAHIVSAEASAGSQDEIPARVDEIAETLRRKLGESLESLKENSVPLAKVSSPSLEAVRYFSLGKESLYQGDPNQAIVMFNKALELDSNFAVAHEYLGLAYQHLADYDRSNEQLRQAALLADRVSEPERLRIMAGYYSMLLDFKKECESAQILAQLQPQDPGPYIISGVCELEQFNYAAAVSHTEKALQFVPQSRVRINLAAMLLLQGDADRAFKVAQAVSHDFTNDAYAQTVLGRAYIALGRLEDAHQVFKGMLQAGADSEIEGNLCLADLAMSTGHYREAETELKAVIFAADKSKNRRAGAKARSALAEIMRSRSSSLLPVREILSQIDLPPNDPTLDFLLGRAQAWSGQFESAHKSVRVIDLLIQQHDVPALRALRYLLMAEIALAQRKFREAVDAAQNAVQYQNSVFAMETLARCYAAAGRHAEAALQYESVLTRANDLLDDSRDESFDTPSFRRAVDTHYRLGVLYQKLGQWGDARIHLQNFLRYWSHADTGLGIYKDAERLLRTLPAAGVPTPAT